MQQKRLAYRPEVDGLRALAVVPVLLFHAGVPGFAGGFVGVDIFFVISGYLITAHIREDLARGAFSIVKFYERRTRRILPALLTMLTIVCVPAWILLPPEPLKRFGQSLLATLGFGSNVLWWIKSGYFDHAAAFKPLLHTWSLAVEEQFYIGFPLLMAFGTRLGRRWLWGLVVGTAVGSLAISLWLTDYEPNANFYLIPSRAWELLAGSLLALASIRDGRELASARVRQWTGLLGFVLIAGCVVGYDEGTPFPGLYAVPPVLGAVWIIGTCASDTLVGRALGHRSLRGIGLISYSLYLWHQPIYVFARIALGREPSLAEYGGLIALSGLAAYVTWAWVEQPFRNRREMSVGRLVGVVVPWGAALCALGLFLHASRGVPRRYPHAEALGQLGKTSAPSPARKCLTGSGPGLRWPRDACRYHGQTMTWAVLGDSQGDDFAHVIAERIRGRGEGLIHLTFGGCAPAVSYESFRPGCRQWLDQALQVLREETTVHSVVLTYLHSRYLYGELKEGSHVERDARDYIVDAPATAQEAAALYWRSFLSLIERLRAMGKRVFVLGPVPELGYELDDFIYPPTIFDTEPRRPRALPVARYVERNAFVLERLQQMEWAPDLAFLDPTLALCDDTFCYVIRHGALLYSDHAHLSLNGAKAVIGSVDDVLDLPQVGTAKGSP